MLRAKTRTKRATSPGAEGMIGVVHRVLDHGEVELVDYMGTDEELVQIARVSTGSERQDTALVDYLVRHRHTSPIEFGRLVLRVKLPIFTARQWVRHRTGAFSERSGRYQPPLNEVYVPSVDFVQGRPTKNKQGRGADLSPEVAEWVRWQVESAGRDSVDRYAHLTNASNGSHEDNSVYPRDYPGVAAEIARSVMPLGTYTEWYWVTDAHNLMHWLRLRVDGHAQKETRVYAEIVLAVFRAWLPVTAEAFEEHVLGAVTFSRRELRVLAKIIMRSGPPAETASSILCKPSLVDEFMGKFNKIRGDER